MYQPDKDRVIELATAPAPDSGAPLPTLISDEANLLIAYIVSDTAPTCDGSKVAVMSPASSAAAIAIVRFRRPAAHLFGPPNDETFDGHPLAARGLQPYSVTEVERSSWIRALERMNSVHPRHNPEPYARLHHYIFTFHDSTFECIAEGLSVQVHRESMHAAVRRMVALLEDAA